MTRAQRIRGLLRALLLGLGILMLAPGSRHLILSSAVTTVLVIVFFVIGAILMITVLSLSSIKQ